MTQISIPNVPAIARHAHDYPAGHGSSACPFDLAPCRIGHRHCALEDNGFCSQREGALLLERAGWTPEQLEVSW